MGMTNADDTRKRILSAATTEFAARGIAGARVDRIAESSGASKPMLYAYFGSKEKLFDAVFTNHVLANSDRVPFTADDLPGYAVRLYDDYLADPDLLRLIAWNRLERVPSGYLYGGLEANDEAHLRDIEVQQRLGIIRSDLDPADIWSLLISASSTWAQVSVTDVADLSEPVPFHVRRKRSLADMVRSGLCAEITVSP
jgi:AcrR family transcriptional regulator